MIQIHKYKTTAVLWFGRGTTNAFDLSFLKQLREALSSLEKDKTICSIVLTGRGNKIFSSGLDLKMICAGKRFRRNIISAVFLIYKIVKQIQKSDKIYFAALSGAVIGSAVSIAMACDIRIGKPDVWFWLPDPQFGGLLADGGLELISHICGGGAAKHFCLFNSRINAKAALQQKLIHQIAFGTSPQDVCINYAKKLGDFSPVTLAMTKKILNGSIVRRFHFIKLIRVVLSKEMQVRIQAYGIRGKKK